MVAFEEGGEEAVEEEHLARGGDNGFVDGEGGLGGPGVVEVERRVTGETELHYGVAEFLVEDFLSLGLCKQCAGTREQYEWPLTCKL